MTRQDPSHSRQSASGRTSGDIRATGALRPLRARDGFTLLELLIAVTVLGLLMVLVLNGLHFGARVWEVGRSGAERLGEIESARSFLRNRIESSMPITYLDGDDERRATVAGDGNRLRIPVLMPSHLGGGLRLLHVGVEQTGAERDLVVVRERIRLSAGEPVDSTPEPVTVLMEDVREVAFAYFGADAEGTNSWQPAWDGSDGPPLLVRIEVVFRRGDRRSWPPVIVAPMVEGEE